MCTDTKRDERLLCVVEQATDVVPIERSGAFRGRYHCLGGRLSPLDNVRPEDLRIGGLLRRIEELDADIEVILALASDVEGDATANYLIELLRGRGCRISRIAQGLPAGGGLEHADELTLLRAMEGRRGVGGGLTRRRATFPLCAPAERGLGCRRDERLPRSENEDGSGPAPGPQAGVDQGAAAEPAAVLVDQVDGDRSEAGHGVRGGAVPEPLGVLEPRHGDLHDRRREVHAGLRVLRGEDGAPGPARGG